MRAKCRYCEATIRWVQLESGKSIPVNPISDPAGTVAASWQGASLIGYVTAKARPLRDGYQLYRAHRADCHPDKPRNPTPAALFDSSSPRRP